MQGEKAKRGRPRKDRPYVPNSCGTNTLTMGPRLRFREHMTKGEFVQACFWFCFLLDFFCDAFIFARSCRTWRSTRAMRPTRSSH